MRLLVVGRARGTLAEAAAEYERRVARQTRFEVVEIKDEPLERGTPVEVLRREGQRLERVIADWPYVVFDRTGEAVDSPGYASLLEEALERPPQRLALVIGGALGVDPAVGARARRRLSLGPITLPHQLARVVVAEQTYRAFTILRGEPYHR